MCGLRYACASQRMSYAIPEQRLTEETAIRCGLVEKAKEFATARGDVYQSV